MHHILNRHILLWCNVCLSFFIFFHLGLPLEKPHFQYSILRYYIDCLFSKEIPPDLDSNSLRKVSKHSILSEKINTIGQSIDRQIWLIFHLVRDFVQLFKNYPVLFFNARFYFLRTHSKPNQNFMHISVIIDTNSSL